MFIKRKFRLVVIAIISTLLITSLSYAKTKIDVKTKFKNKVETTAAKNGIISYLKSSNWAEVVSVGEDYSLWIKDYNKTKEGNEISISFTLELRTAAMFTEGKLISKEKVNIKYTYSENLVEELKNKEPNASNFLLKMMESTDDHQMYVEALIIGEKSEKIIKKLVNKGKK